MQGRALALLSVMIVVAGCRPAPAPPSAVRNTLADLGAIAGWSPVGETVSYDADGLWQLIDGAADRFIANGFRSLEVGQLSSGEARVEVQVYDMGAQAEARAMLAAEAPGLEPLAIGDGAVVSPPYQALLASGRLYVKIDVLEGHLDEAGGRALVAALDAALAAVSF